MRKGRPSSYGQNGQLVQSWGLVHSKNLAPCEQRRHDCFDSCGVALIPVEFCRRTICIVVVYKNVESSSSRRHQIFDTGASSTSDLSSFSSSGCFFGFFGSPLEDQCRFSCLFFITTSIITIIFAWRQRLSSNNLHEECGIEKSMSCKP